MTHIIAVDVDGETLHLLPLANATVHETSAGCWCEPEGCWYRPEDALPGERYRGFRHKHGVS